MATWTREHAEYTQRQIANELDPIAHWLNDIAKLPEEELRHELAAKRRQIRDRIVSLLPELHDG